MRNITRVESVAIASVTMCAVALWIGCSEPSRTASRAVSTVVAQQQSLALPVLQRERVRYALDAIATLEREWPWMTTRETCVLLIDAEIQWGLNCVDAPLPDFIRLPEPLRGQPIFARRGGNLLVDGQALSGPDFAARQVATAVVDRPRTRIPNLAPTHAWLVLSSLEALRRWHPQFADASTEEWLSLFVHEFFHTRQLLVSGLTEQLSRFGVDNLDQAPLIALYQQDPEYRALVEREHRQLADVAERSDPSEAAARAALAEWRRNYQERRAFLARQEHGELLVQADILFTYIEGTARYVENRFMVEADQHPAASIAGDPAFSRFANREGRGRAGMINLGLGARYYYAIGFNLSSVLDWAEPSWKQRVHATPDWLIGLALTSPSP